MDVAPGRRTLVAVPVLCAVLLLVLAMPYRAGAQITDPRNESIFGPPRGSGLSTMRRPNDQFRKKPPKEAPKKDLSLDDEPLMPGETPVVEVRVIGNETVKKEKILPYIYTRVGRAFRIATIERDVRRLYKSGLFMTVEPLYEEVPGGRVVIFRVAERPMLREVAFIRNEELSLFDSLFSSTKKQEKKLQKVVHLKPGDPADPSAVEEGRRALEAHYREKGYAKVRVSILEGNKLKDRRAVYVIHEGPKEKIVWTRFLGNTIASDARLLTQVESKQGPFWLFKGEFDPEKLKADEEKLTAYYRGLGFFRASVSHIISHVNFPYPWSNPQPVITFVIDEGQRWKVRDVSFIGNNKIPTTELREALKLHAEDFFNQDKMDGDVRRIREEYGSIGYVFCDVKAEPRFLEEPGQLDLVFNVKEGDQYRAGRINVHIGGDSPHTKITALLNPLSIQPGDIIDTRKIRASEVRYLQSRVFNSDRQQGKMPKVVFSPADIKKVEEQDAPPHERIARPMTPQGYRGQSPDDRSRPAYSPRYGDHYGTTRNAQPTATADYRGTTPRYGAPYAAPQAPSIPRWVFLAEPRFDLAPPSWHMPPVDCQWPYRQDGGLR